MVDPLLLSFFYFLLFRYVPPPLPFATHLSGAELSLVQETFASNYIAARSPMLDALGCEFAAQPGIPYGQL